MVSLPIVRRELRLAARRPRTYAVRAAAAFLAIVTALGLLSPSFRGLQPPAASGAQLFMALAVGLFILCLLAGAFVTADSVSEEKRAGTLGFLLLTPLKSHEIVFGKLLATSLNPFYAVIAALPMLALPQLLGGVTAGEFWRMALLLVNTLFFSLAAGLVVSTFSHNGHKAMAGTLLLLFGWAGLPLLGLVSGPAAGGPAAAVAVLSPGYGFYLAFEQPFATAPAAFGISVLLIHLVAWLMLAAASRRLPRCRLETPLDPARPPSPRPRPRRLAGLAGLSRAPSLPETVVEPEPIAPPWQPHRASALWGLLFLALVVWWLGYTHWQKTWLRAELVFAATLGLHTALKLGLALEASRHLAAGRRSGELELLLVTPLPVEDIFRGRLLALKRQFLAPVALVLAIDLGWVLFFMQPPGWWGRDQLWALATLVGMGLFAADMYTLSWVGLWQGLAARNSSQALVRTIGLVLVLPWLLYLPSLALLAPALPLLADAGWATLWWFLLSMATCLGLCVWARNHLELDFREAAADLADSGTSGPLRWRRFRRSPPARVGPGGSEAADTLSLPSSSE